MLTPMHPDTGGRFSLHLREHDAARARYALTLAIPGAEWTVDAAVAAADGGIELGAWQGAGEPPPWLLQYARAALRSSWRAHAEQGWPRRLTRWRDAPSRSELATPAERAAGGERSGPPSDGAASSVPASSED